MRRGFFPWGCLLVVLMLVVLAMAGGAWWYFGTQRNLVNSPPGSPVQVFLVQPSSGDEVHAGDYVAVSLNAFAPAPISKSELFVDGHAFGAVSDSPDNASWTWQAWPAGVHTLSARATDSDGEQGNSQPVIVNVVALADTVQVAATNGETLAQVGEKFGVPPDQMGGVNPGMDPKTPLKDDQPVNVPTGGGGGAAPQPPGGGGPGGDNSPPMIVWDFKIKGAADKSYCYLSAGDGVWQKMPKDPFDFFGKPENLYTQLLDALPAQDGVLQAQCWGWLGGALKFLGQGQGKFDGQKVPIVTDSFELVGQPQLPGNSPQFGVIKPQVPAPYALREPADAADCSSHGHPLLAPFICDTLLKEQVKQHYVLEWEWQPAVSIPGGTMWINDVSGYNFYEIDPSNNSQKLLKQVTPPANKIAAVQLGYFKVCWGVEAYAVTTDYGKLTSAMATYCPGDEPPTQVLTLAPIHWLSSDRVLWNDCSVPAQDFTDEASPPAIFVGGRDVNVPDKDCTARIIYAGAVDFGSPVLPPGGVLLQASLKASKVWSYFFVSQTAGPGYDCVHALGTAKQDWSAFGHHSFGVALDTAAYFNPLTSQVNLGLAGTNVTPVVSNWIQHPSEDHGFIFVGVPPSLSPEGGNGECYTGLGNLQLVIHYIAP